VSSATGSFARSSNSNSNSNSTQYTTPSIASSQGTPIPTSQRIRARGIDSEPPKKRLKTSSTSAIENEAMQWIISTMKEKEKDGGRVLYNTVELAIQLLQNEYETRLSTGHFLIAVDFLTSEVKASAFITLNGQIRDIWLCKSINVELI
jgi:hypothetical protein